MYIESSPNPDGYVPNSNLFGPWSDSPTQVIFFAPASGKLVVEISGDSSSDILVIEFKTLNSKVEEFKIILILNKNCDFHKFKKIFVTINSVGKYFPSCGLRNNSH